MCGRFTRFQSWKELRDTYRLVMDDPPEGFRPRFNVAPGQRIELAASRADGTRGFGAMRWGLVPAWAKDEQIGYKMINARSETVAEKPAFRTAFQRRRCIVPASGFYEWQAGEAKHKQPFHFTRADGDLLSFAGLWEKWDGGTEPLYSFTILTAAANETMAAYHHRMPVILERAAINRWLDPQTPPETLMPLFAPARDDVLQASPVSRDVNRVANDNPALITPIKDELNLLF